MMLIKAFIVCLIKHWKQKDKAGKRYIWHPIYVMFNVKGYNEKVVALLHDIIEDTDTTLDDLRYFRFNDTIIRAVDIISKKKGQKYFEYLENIRNNEIARKVKIQDLKHNSNLKRLSRITQKDIERVKKYEKALIYLNI